MHDFIKGTNGLSPLPPVNSSPLQRPQKSQPERCMLYFFTIHIFIYTMNRLTPHSVIFGLLLWKIYLIFFFQISKIIQNSDKQHKHDLARSDRLKIWPSYSSPEMTKFRKISVLATTFPGVFFYRNFVTSITKYRPYFIS